ncbi:MAG: DNA primase, phage associated [Candidatus Rifleibacterium amylolyticum]|nr:MAG: DNA primase, phage associated [Candidatus Rifleibacterium amylolyticum]
MTRVSDAELERLKKEVPIQRLTEAQGIKLQPHGKNLIGLCPFHDDKEPSLVITPEKNLWNCLGACGSGGTVIDWVMKAEKLSFREAVNFLQSRSACSESSLATTATKSKPAATSAAPISLETADHELMLQVVDYYHEALKASPEAISYLEKRGIYSPEIITKFKLGFSNRTFGLNLPVKQVKSGLEIRTQLQKLGLYRDSGHEHFAGSVVFPIFGSSGHVSEIYGRKIRNNLRAGTAYHLYLPGPHAGIFNPECLAADEIILCESIIDALSFYANGFKNVTTAYGVNGFTEELFKAITNRKPKKVIIAFDRDEAGDKAALKIADKLSAAGVACYRAQFPKGMDANAFTCQMKPAAKALSLVLQKADVIGKIVEPAIEASFHLAAKQKMSETLPEICSTIDQDKPEPNNVQQPEQSPLPEAENLNIEIKEEEIILKISDRRWRVRGLDKNMSYEQLKVNLLVSRNEFFHVDTFDMYSARARQVFTKQAANELRVKEDLIRSDTGKLLLKLEEIQDKLIKNTLEPKEKEIKLTPQEEAEALELLRDPNLIQRILKDFEIYGIVGEETNKLVGYLAAVSRKLDAPLAVIVQSSSAAGKTSLMESILAFMPEEERVKYSAMTGQSLFYMSETNLKHKILAIVEEEGAERASYAIKLLQSEGELTIASTGKDPASGRLVTHEYRVEGPVMIFITTTSIDIDEELNNRCLILGVNESREQTRAIHKLQRERRTLKGQLLKKEKDKVLRVHRNAQRLLKAIPVINPYAEQLTFMDDRTRTRRDHEKYLTLIDTIALLHQYQRPIKKTPEGQLAYIESTLQDIETANRLADDILGHSLDELPPQSRRLLLLIEEMALKACERLQIAIADYRFSRRDIREYTGIGNTQLRVHLARLEELEYLIPHRGSRGQTFEYELFYDGKGKDGKTFLHGLISVEKLRGNYDVNLAGVKDNKARQIQNNAGLKRGQNGGVAGACRGVANEESELIKGQKTAITLKNAHLEARLENSSYRSHDFPPACSDLPPVRGLAAKGKAFKGNGSEKTIEEAE